MNAGQHLFSRSVLIAVLGLLLSGSALAQTAWLKGTVLDERGEARSGVGVTLCQREMCVQATTTDKAGKYEFSMVKPGVYDLRFEDMSEARMPNFLLGNPGLGLPEEYEFDAGVITTLTETCLLHVVVPREIPTPEWGSSVDPLLMSTHCRSEQGYYIDGIRVEYVWPLPQRSISIEELKVITGGAPPEYGDSGCGLIFSGSPRLGTKLKSKGKALNFRAFKDR